MNLISVGHAKRCITHRTAHLMALHFCSVCVTGAVWKQQTVTEAGFELSNFNREYHLLGLRDGHGKTNTRASAYCVCMGGWGGTWATVHWTGQQVAAANYRQAAPVTYPLHRHNAVKWAVLHVMLVMHVLHLLARPICSDLWSTHYRVTWSTRYTVDLSRQLVTWLVLCKSQLVLWFSYNTDLMLAKLVK